MVVVVHLHIRMNPEPCAHARFPQGPHKGSPIPVIAHVCLPAVPARHHMIHRPFKLYSHLFRHPCLFGASSNNLNIKWLTPIPKTAGFAYS